MIPPRLAAFILAVLIAISSLSARPLQAEGGRFFEETGFWVRGEFFALYNSAPDPGRLLGLPISETMPDPQRPGILVQYFERARMDYDPTLPEGSRVSLAPLGSIHLDENRAVEPLSFSTNTNMCRAIGEHAVCFAFLQFYDSYDGKNYLGLPITGTEVIDGQVAQVFEFGRVEWHPDLPSGQRVVVSELGRLDYLLRMGTGPNGASIASSRPLSLTAYAFLDRAVAAVGQSQRVSVLVVDQSGAPVPDADVLVTIRYPDGQENRLRPNRLTDENGVTGVEFEVSNVRPNDVVMVSVEASIAGGSPSTTASTSFRIWW